eukprot:g17604.t1
MRVNLERLPILAAYVVLAATTIFLLVAGNDWSYSQAVPTALFLTVQLQTVVNAVADQKAKAQKDALAGDATKMKTPFVKPKSSPPSKTQTVKAEARRRK